MLNLYYGNETLKRENFIYEQIRNHRESGLCKSQYILLVPDQFSLQAEKNALKYLGKKSLMDFMVADFSSLGRKVVKAAGVKEPELIDKYGRHMLLSVLIEEIEEELKVYRGYGGRNSFTAMTNQLISEMKRYGVKPEHLGQKVEEDRLTNMFLKQKLEDIKKIYESYEKAIEGKYIDSEDYIRFYGEWMLRSDLIRGSEIWIYGFDAFSPLNLEIIQRLIASADSVNVVMTWENPENTRAGGGPGKDARFLTTGNGEQLFELSGFLIDRLKELAKEVHSEVSIQQIPASDSLKRETIWQKENLPLTMVQASNVYEEAEALASWITGLVRDEEYSYGDITVICNDMDQRGGILKRTLEKYDIPVFADRKRGVLHQPVVNFLLALCDVISGREDAQSMMTLVKSGMMAWSSSEEELLENYVTEFRIRSTQWRKPFTKGNKKYSQQELKHLNDMRTTLADIIRIARDEIGRRNTAKEKILGLYRFLEEKFQIRDRIIQIIDKQRELGLKEPAAETAQSWNMICALFDQMLKITGDSRISNQKLRDLIKAGLEEMEIGLVPVASDLVIIGTMQRTRISSTKVLAVVGANEGVIPMNIHESGMLTERELDILEDLKLNLSKRETVIRQEEQMAIYRTMSLPEEKLYVSCSLADQDGKGILPSVIFETLKGREENMEILGDLDKRAHSMDMISGDHGTLGYLSAAIRRYADGDSEHLDQNWIPVIHWYLENDRAAIDRIWQGMNFRAEVDSLGSDLADALYRGDKEKISVSASRLERYSACPFSHFIRYGLNAEEQREFQVDARDIGDAYHDCLMEFSKALTPPDGILEGTGKTAWLEMTQEECRKKVREILKGESGNHREGIFQEESSGRFRMECIEDICSDVAWALVNQVKRGDIKEMHFEEPFGRNGDFEISLDHGEKININGKIDRLDLIGDERAIRVVDYKTGSNEVDLDQIKAGYKLQLMLYMNAARHSHGDGQSGLQPAGIFYFKIRDYNADVSTEITPEEKGALLQDTLQKQYRLEGVVNDNIRLIEEMDTDLQGVSAKGEKAESMIIPVKYVKKDECYKGASKGILLSQTEFEELCRETTDHVKRICNEICGGEISIKPKREKKKDMSGVRVNACKHCLYKSICMFDTSFGCRFEDI